MQVFPTLFLLEIKRKTAAFVPRRTFALCMRLLFEKGNGCQIHQILSIRRFRFGEDKGFFMYNAARFFYQRFQPEQRCARRNNVVYNAHFFAFEQIGVVFGKVEFLRFARRNGRLNGYFDAVLHI